MKRFTNVKTVAVTLTLLVTGSSVFAQWNGTNPLTTTSAVGIGTVSTPEGLQITKTITNEQGTVTGLRAGVLDGTPRLIFDHVGKNSFEIDNLEGRFRIFTPGVERFTITPGGDIGVGVKAPEYRVDIQQGFGSGTQTTLFVGQRHIDGAATGRYGIGLQFEHIDGTSAGKKAHIGMWYSNVMTKVISFNNLGNVGIGTASPDAKLTVNGDIHAREVRVDLNIPAPDYVFESDYKLMPLSELELYLRKNKHLPEVPSSDALQQNGVELKEMNMLLLKKVEELTLYMIELKKENDTLQKRVEKLEKSK